MTKRQNIALILNIAALLCGTVGIVFRLMRGVGDFFLYYTQISNVVAVISSAMYIAFRGTANVKLRTLVICSRYLAACMLTMTFTVVMCIFIPFSAGAATPRLLGSVNGVMHHAVCPVISVISYIFFESGVRKHKAMLIPFIATAIYSFTIYALNILRLAGAPYPFFEVYDHPVWQLVLWFFALMALVAGIAAAVRFANVKAGSEK